MKILKVTKREDIQEGDTLLLTGDTLVREPVKVMKIKESAVDGVEVIFDMRMNRFFNLGMFLNGKSWVKECYVILSSSDNLD